MGFPSTRMKRYSYIIAGVIMLALAGFLVWQQTGKGSKAEVSGDSDEVVKPVEAPAINGLMVSPEAAERRPVAVMIENHPDSRPQSGLSSADIVYETLAEGGITRYEAIYQTADDVKAGPVRSVRSYFGQIASEYGAVLAHVGGSDDALAALQSGRYKGVDDADEYYLGSYFERVRNRPAPHNTYTTLSRLRELISDKQWDTENSASAWQFSDETIMNAIPANEVTLNYSTASYQAKFIYDPATGLYTRSLAGKLDIDANTSQPVTATTIVAQEVTVMDIPNDPKLRVDIDLDGTGKAYIFYKGQVLNATWKKENNRTHYYSASGQEIAFLRGKIWVGLVPDESDSISWK